MFKALVKLANYFDSNGDFEKANIVDGMMSTAQDYLDDDSGTGVAEREVFQVPDEDNSNHPQDEYEDWNDQFQPSNFSGLTVTEEEVLAAFSNGIPISADSNLAVPYFSMQKSPTAWNIINLMQTSFQSGSMTIKDIDKILYLAKQEGYNPEQLKRTTLDAATYIGIVNDIRGLWSEEVGKSHEPFDLRNDPEALKSIRDFNDSRTEPSEQVQHTDSVDLSGPDGSLSFDEWVNLKVDRLVGVAESIVEDFRI